MIINLKELIGKLNGQCRAALESAAGLCLTRTHYDVDIEHWFLKLVETTETDIQLILRYSGIDVGRLTRDLVRALAHFKTGNDRTPSLSPRVPRLIEAAWVIASIHYGANEIASGHLFLALCDDSQLFTMMKTNCGGLDLIRIEDLEKNFGAIVKDSKETHSHNQSAKSHIQTFISYRHEEWASARTIYTHLTSQFGNSNVFRDQDILVAGDDWKKTIEEHITSCSVLVALIGKYWVSAKSLHQLQNDDDWVRFEISTALSRNIRLIPVLLDGAKMPKADRLPESLHAITQRQAIAINDTDFNEKMAQLGRALKKGT